LLDCPFARTNSWQRGPALRLWPGARTLVNPALQAKEKKLKKKTASRSMELIQLARGFQAVHFALLLTTKTKKKECIEQYLKVETSNI